jgi:hypothetical protein
VPSGTGRLSETAAGQVRNKNQANDHPQIPTHFQIPLRFLCGLLFKIFFFSSSLISVPSGTGRLSEAAAGQVRNKNQANDHPHIPTHFSDPPSFPLWPSVQILLFFSDFSSKRNRSPQRNRGRPGAQRKPSK